MANLTPKQKEIFSQEKAKLMDKFRKAATQKRRDDIQKQMDRLNKAFS